MQPISYACNHNQFPPEVIRRAIWRSLRFTLSCRDVEELLAEREIETSYETVRRRVLQFGPVFARTLRRSGAEQSMVRGRDGGLHAGPAHVPVAIRRQRGRDPQRA